MTATRIDIAIFAHNEAHNMDALLATLARQDIAQAPDLSVRFVICANGCTDDTVPVARAIIAGMDGADAYDVVDLAQGGKSRTWNHFVHTASRADADLLMFCDADIILPNADVLRGLVMFLQDRPDVMAASTRPVKDIVHSPENLSLSDRLIAAAGGTLDDWRRNICGQLYVARSATVRKFHLPVGLPVEDGFVRAMIATDVFSIKGDPTKIDGDPALFHVYASERSIGALVRHQVRIVIGGAINRLIYERMTQTDDKQALLKAAADDPDWLTGVVKAELPTSYGYVPRRLLTKRLDGLRGASVKRKGVILLGFGFDLVVYVIAQFKMMRGHGVGYW